MAFLIRVGHGGDDFGYLSVLIEEVDLCINARAFGWAHHGPPIVQRIFFEEQEFELAAGSCVDAVKPRRDDFGIVQDQHVAWTQAVEQIRKAAMLNLRGCALEQKQARLPATALLPYTTLYL